MGEPAGEGRLTRILTGRAGVLVFSALSLVLAIALVASLSAWRYERRAFQARIAELTEQNGRAQALWKAQLATCQASSAPRGAVQAGGAAPGDEAARRLLAQGPEGIDGCARMESADQAVLATLK